ncbi:AAA family ATPase [Vibrio sp. SCSIO 43137]|uniref:AAA family ATPase n=1 Tax=Vibrio sp. SCSIO 43137 TaxID=3021011 RepID=UPI0023078D5D|nr:AAA family ATPase [Vibrio sp. SCSIO 43137]WCE32073.1 AAA family ATPase [Vibrio sp. SCSIO 43137]
MIRAEYLRFLQTLQDSGTSDSVRKIANIVSAHLDEVIPLGTHQGQRIRKIVQLCHAHWDGTPTQVPAISLNNGEQTAQISSLRTMTVGPFRGFSRQEVFDLNSRLVLIYGPNGTGKSSFCEALEYSLLGNVAEAESKRFREQNEYLKNAFVNALTHPEVVALDYEGNDVRIESNESVYRFCFVEKNRIDNFSRIAAQAPAKQTELIATLFGLEKFTEFVRSFTSDIGNQYIDVQGKQAIQLLQKQQGLQGAEQQIQLNNTELQRIASEEINLANNYRVGATYDQLIVELNGNTQTLGLIRQLDAELQQAPPLKANLVKANLVTVGNETAATINELRQKQKQLTEAGQQVSFKQLYEAVTQLQPSSPDVCPACKTPLQQVVVNPYMYAGQELNKLHQLAELQQNVALLEQQALQGLFNISQTLNTCLRFFPQNNPLQFLQITNGQPSLLWWDSLLSQLPDNCSGWQHLVGQVEQLEAMDKQVDKALGLRESKLSELNRLREIDRQVTVLSTQKKTALNNLAKARMLINNFQTDNAQLIADVEAEKAAVAKNKEIVTAYAMFVQKINGYNNGLPAKLVADLGEQVVELYNAFNRNDVQTELLASVQLPLAQHQRLKISFKDQPDKFFDALHILSEGHVRCLGLAILLAKNLKEQAPILIFDDPVNAIDDDHRESIRRSLFEDGYFSEKQIILTCHGEEFFKDIQNLLPAGEVRESRLLSFLPRLGEQHIRVDFNCAPRNYILAAANHIERNEVREALSKARQALEALTKGKVWKYVNRHGDGNLSIKLRSSSAPIELRNLTDQLRSKINKPDFQDIDKSAVYDPINVLLGINGGSREWRYLNKGTHEENDRSEFDRGTVNAIIAALTSLDQALS